MFDNFDNDLVMNIRNGAPYYWERGAIASPAVSLAVRAVPLQDIATDGSYDPDSVPAVVTQLLVSQNDKHLIALGAVPFGSTDTDDFDPLLIRWADQDNPGQWTPGVTNSAGFLRVSRGSRIVRGAVTRQEILIFTESHLYSLQFLGTTDVFSLQEYADNISIMSPRAVATANNITYWMGLGKFYMYTGRVDTLPCTVRTYVFNDFNYAQSEQVICGTNEEFNEIWWFYPSSLSSTNDRYVIFNYLEQVWYYGQLSRTAWIDSPLRGFPQAVCDVGYIFNQEAGVTANGAAMGSYIITNDLDLDEGDRFILCYRVLPDISFDKSTAETPQVTFTIKTRNFPGSAFNNSNDDTANVISTSVGQYTQQIFIRARARQMALQIGDAPAGTFWTLGSPRVDGRPDGRR